VTEAVVDQETALVVDSDDSSQLALAIERLLSDSGLARRLGEAGRKRVIERFSWDDRQRILVRLIEG